ncbi:unnamed protein product [Caenorhabditis angaria]|uniref:FERM domain-containing protein n=1 Tax=Caenorhabditis angaria TaxID=860376 RepID=A0A9P1MXC8_9PELO|nr:unnamed protein product [Caenorhabditis angaria]
MTENRFLQKVDHNKFGRDTLLDEAINAYLHGLLIAGSKEEMAKMAAILARKMHGNSGNGNGMEYKPSAKNLANIYPQYMLDNHDRTKLADRLKIAMKKNETRNDRQLEDDFLSISRGLMTYGASFFEVDVFTTKKNFGNGQALVGVNDHGLHIILKKAWNVKNLRFDEFAAIFRDSKTIEIDAQRSRDLHFIMVSTQMKFLKGILQKFQG